MGLNGLPVTSWQPYLHPVMKVVFGADLIGREVDGNPENALRITSGSFLDWVAGHLVKVNVLGAAEGMTRWSMPTSQLYSLVSETTFKCSPCYSDTSLVACKTSGS